MLTPDGGVSPESAMAPEMNCAWIAGASGLVGSHLLELLLDDARVAKVVSLGRRESPIHHAKLAKFTVDFADLPHDLPSPTAAFCCLGTTIQAAGSREAFRRVDHDYPIAFAQAARQAGASTFLLISAIGSSSDSRMFYSRVKGEVEHSICALPFEAVHIARPSLLLGKRREFRLGERLSTPLFYALWPVFLGRLKKYRAIHARRVAKALAGLAFSDARGVHLHESDELARLSR
jgi:uncharacterized protein YbjT (DUF2867 family)